MKTYIKEFYCSVMYISYYLGNNYVIIIVGQFADKSNNIDTHFLVLSDIF